ncbi:MAG: hypothetical protein ABII74_03725 [Elusimicrobiota bacterium]
MKKLVSVIVVNCFLFTTVLPSYANTNDKFYLRAPHSGEIVTAVTASENYGVTYRPFFPYKALWEQFKAGCEKDSKDGLVKKLFEEKLNLDSSRTGWLTILERNVYFGMIERLKKIMEDVRKEGLETSLVDAIGGSVNGVIMIRSLTDKTVELADTLEPMEILARMRRLGDLRKTLFIVTCKSWLTMETLKTKDRCYAELFKLYYQEKKQNNGEEFPLSDKELGFILETNLLGVEPVVEQVIEKLITIMKEIQKLETEAEKLNKEIKQNKKTISGETGELELEKLKKLAITQQQIGKINTSFKFLLGKEVGVGMEEDKITKTVLELKAGLKEKQRKELTNELAVLIQKRWEKSLGGIKWEEFRQRIVSKLGLTEEIIEEIKKKVGRQFLIVSDPGKADFEGIIKYFREVLYHDPDNGGRFASFFDLPGLVPADFMSDNLLEDLIKWGKLGQKLCQNPEIITNAGEINNPGFAVANFLEVIIKNRYRLVNVVFPPELKDSNKWWDEMYSESVNKPNPYSERVALNFVEASGELKPGEYKMDSDVFIHIKIAGQEDKALAEKIEKLKAAKFPVLEIVLPYKEAYGALVYIEMVAIAMYGYKMRVNPFNEPGVWWTKDTAKQLLEKGEEKVEKTIKAIREGSYDFLLQELNIEKIKQAFIQERAIDEAIKPLVELNSLSVWLPTRKDVNEFFAGTEIPPGINNLLEKAVQDSNWGKIDPNIEVSLRRALIRHFYPEATREIEKKAILETKRKYLEEVSKAVTSGRKVVSESGKVIIDYGYYTSEIRKGDPKKREDEIKAKDEEFDEICQSLRSLTKLKKLELEEAGIILAASVLLNTKNGKLYADLLRYTSRDQFKKLPKIWVEGMRKEKIAATVVDESGGQHTSHEKYKSGPHKAILFFLNILSYNENQDLPLPGSYFTSGDLIQMQCLSNAGILLKGLKWLPEFFKDFPAAKKFLEKIANEGERGFADQDGLHIQLADADEATSAELEEIFGKTFELIEIMENENSNKISEVKRVIALGAEGAEYLDNNDDDTYYDLSIRELDKVIASGGKFVDEARELKKELFEKVLLQPIIDACGYDLRFVADKPAKPGDKKRTFLPRHAREVGFILGAEYARKGDPLLITGDARASRDKLRRELSRGLREQGVNVIFTDEYVPGPAAKLITEVYGILSIHICGTQNTLENPAENGFKIRVRVDGKDKDQIGELWGKKLIETMQCIGQKKYPKLDDFEKGKYINIEELNDGNINLLVNNSNNYTMEKVKRKARFKFFLDLMKNGVLPLEVVNGEKRVVKDERKKGILELYKNIFLAGLVIDKSMSLSENIEGFGAEKNMLVEGIGLKFAQYWQKLGKDAPCLYLEAGKVMEPILADFLQRMGMKKGTDFEFTKAAAITMAEHYKDEGKKARPAYGIIFKDDGEEFYFIAHNPITGSVEKLDIEQLMPLGYEDSIKENARQKIPKHEKMKLPIDVRMKGIELFKTRIKDYTEELKKRYRAVFEKLAANKLTDDDLIFVEPFQGRLEAAYQKLALRGINEDYEGARIEAAGNKPALSKINKDYKKRRKEIIEKNNAVLETMDKKTKLLTMWRGLDKEGKKTILKSIDNFGIVFEVMPSGYPIYTTIWPRGLGIKEKYPIINKMTGEIEKKSAKMNVENEFDIEIIMKIINASAKKFSDASNIKKFYQEYNKKILDTMGHVTFQQTKALLDNWFGTPLTRTELYWIEREFDVTEIKSLMQKTYKKFATRNEEEELSLAEGRSFQRAFIELLYPGTSRNIPKKERGDDEEADKDVDVGKNEPNATVGTRTFEVSRFYSEEYKSLDGEIGVTEDSLVGAFYLLLSLKDSRFNSLPEAVLPADKIITTGNIGFKITASEKREVYSAIEEEFRKQICQGYKQKIEVEEIECIAPLNTGRLFNFKLNVEGEEIAGNVLIRYASSKDEIVVKAESESREGLAIITSVLDSVLKRYEKKGRISANVAWTNSVNRTWQDFFISEAQRLENNPDVFKKNQSSNMERLSELIEIQVNNLSKMEGSDKTVLAAQHEICLKYQEGVRLILDKLNKKDKYSLKDLDQLVFEQKKELSAELKKICNSKNGWLSEEILKTLERFRIQSFFKSPSNSPVTLELTEEIPVKKGFVYKQIVKSAQKEFREVIDQLDKELQEPPPVVQPANKSTAGLLYLENIFFLFPTSVGLSLAPYMQDIVNWAGRHPVFTFFGIPFIISAILTVYSLEQEDSAIGKKWLKALDNENIRIILIALGFGQLAISEVFQWPQLRTFSLPFVGISFGFFAGYILTFIRAQINERKTSNWGSLGNKNLHREKLDTISNKRSIMESL